MHTENGPVNGPENIVSDVDYMLVCGIIWRKTGDPIAGWELIRGLKSEDRYLREIAKRILVECGQSSMKLLESAFANGSVNSDSAGECISEMFRAQSKEAWTRWERVTD